MDSPESKDNSLREKICLVCGDKALGYNFNAITCESCKAFFRRNALKNKDFKCPFNKKCEINMVTRRFCQLCRLIKCFEIGMKKEYIMSENDKLEKRRKIEQKRSGRVNADRADEPDSFEEENSPKRSKYNDSPPEIKINPLNLAPTCSQTYQSRSVIRRNSKGSNKNPPEDNLSSSCEENLNNSLDHVRMLGEPFASPVMPEPSSPVGSAVVDDLRNHNYETNRSRPAEIYNITKVSGHTSPSLYKKNVHVNSEPNRVQSPFKNSSIIENILATDAMSDSNSEAIDCRVVDRSYEDSYSPPPPRAETPRQEPLLSSLVNNNSELPKRKPTFQTEVADEVLRDIPRISRLDAGSSIDSILTEAIKLEYEAYSSMNCKNNSRELNHAERAKLNELIFANKALLAPLEQDVTSVITQDVMSKSNLGLRPMLLDVLNLTAIAIRRLIKMSKKVNAFKNMCQEDQVALLKGGCTEMMILRSAMTYDSDRGSWKIPHSKERQMNIKVDVLKEAGGRVFEEHQKFLQTFDPRWRNDENIMVILSAITLFSPDRPRVVHYDVIKLEQNSYYYLLRRYLESTYPGCEARSTFLKLIQKIMELNRLNEDHVRVYMELNPEDVEPLLIEIFDLNPH